MGEFSLRICQRAAAAGTAALAAAALLAGCGGSGSGSGTTSRTAATSQSSSTTASTTTTTATAPPAGTLGLSPAHPATKSELTFTFTAPVASGVHGSHVISYGLSLLGPDQTGCVGTKEVGSPQVAKGARTQITVGPTQLHAPWCAGRYLARLLELRSAHCTGSAPCPQYIAVVGLVGRVAFTIRPG